MYAQGLVPMVAAPPLPNSHACMALVAGYSGQEAFDTTTTDLIDVEKQRRPAMTKTSGMVQWMENMIFFNHSDHCMGVGNICWQCCFYHLPLTKLSQIVFKMDSSLMNLRAQRRKACKGIITGNET
ncbi:hypothetical protein AVEN_18482-1 [Araneus ventricosus]|uniref:Uncharacterized protein n=1 Tax=Araneus ventricosus TaxID=182803 RepID=A0A4Y2WTX4_ARAVE|nr:hypothetical protein AVEN_18482-1 [Araneus ventricosus]